MINNKQPWYTSVIFIVITFIFFWPLGFVMLYLRWYKNDGKYKAINNLLLACTIFLIFMGLLGTIIYITSHLYEDILFAVLIFLVPGFICGFFWLKRKNKIKGYSRYLEYIHTRKNLKIDALCNKLNVDYDTATNVLADMINKGMIKGYLDEDELVLSDNKSNGNSVVLEKPTVNKDTKVVKCKECGAKNTIIVGEKNECEYCGTLLQ